MQIKRIIINKKLVYDPHTHSLSVANEEHSQMPLAIPASRCLYYLLENQGQVVSHQALLNAVWKARGMNVSPGTLYQNISVLRKVLTTFGSKEGFIKTVPKRGFIISNENVVEFISEAVDDEAVIGKALISVNDDLHHSDDDEINPSTSSFHHHSSTDESENRGCAERRARITGSNYIFCLFGLVVTAVALFTLSWFLLHYFTQKQVSLPLSEKLPEGCDVVFTNTVNSQKLPELKKQIKEIMHENKLLCPVNTRIYFANYTSISPQNYGRTLLSWCRLNDAQKVLSCNNFYYLDWRTW